MRTPSNPGTSLLSGMTFLNRLEKLSVSRYRPRGIAVRFGIFIKSMLDSIKDLQKSDKEMSERVGSVEVLVAGTYVKRDELRELMRKLEQIDAKLDRKANKDECGVRHQP